MSSPNTAWTLLFTAAATTLTACGGGEELPSTSAAGPDEPAPVEASSEPERGPATLKLAGLLGTARIESPLLGVEPAADLSSLDDAALDVLLEEGFDDFDWDYEGWSRLDGAGVVSAPGGKVLRIERPAGRPNMGWVLPVQTDAFYHFERAVQVEGEPFCDLYVVESRLEFEDARIEARDYFLAGRGQALKVHGLPIQSGEESEGAWQRNGTSFYPTPRTRSLIVLVRPRVGIDRGAQVQAMSFDDVLLEEVLPSREDRIRLLKAAYAEPDVEDPSGMRKAGWLLPLPSAGGVQEGEPAESNYNWRRALYAPPTTEMAFDLTFPEGARLRLATGLARETPARAAARFQVEVFGPDGGAPEVLLDTVRTARMEEWHWEEADLDLSAWAGREGTLVLRTLGEQGDPHPLWADPRLEAASDAADPLVILIAVDTLRADHLSSYGYERPTSPSLDRLAAEGVRFDQARSNCNWTCPSFASIFTGLVPSRHGVSSYGPATPLPDELVTLAEHFQGRGWSTRSIAYKVPLFDGNYEQGFDEAFNVPRDVIRGEENLARALEWLENHRGGPSFLFLHFNDPHQPFVQPEPYDTSYGPGPDALGFPTPPGVPSSGDEQATRLFVDLYDGAVTYVDSCIGRFLDALRERGLYEQASIAFVADHGEQLWEHGRFGHGGDDLYDEIVRVPLIVKPAAGTFEPGRVVAADVSGFDVMPTLLELAGVAPAGPLDARSLVPLIRGELEELGRPVVTETSQRGLALVDGGFKFVLRPGGGPEVLFDLAGDPLERQDVAADRPDELARLRSLAIAYLLEHRSGDFLLVHTGGEPARLEVASPTLRTLVGPSPSNGASASTVELAANAWSLFELEGAGAAEAGVTGLAVHGPTEGFAPWVPGSLAQLDAVGVWRLRGPDPRTVGIAEASAPVNVEQLEALQRLGYAE